MCKQEKFFIYFLSTILRVRKCDQWTSQNESCLRYSL